MNTPTPASGGIRVLHKTLDILECLKQTTNGMRLAELARTVELPKATVYRILVTLESRGYLDRSEDGLYRMARKAFALEREASGERILSTAAEPLMAELASTTRETINLGILDAGEVVVLNSVESPQAVRMTSKIGSRRYVHTTALGKAMLATLPEREVLRLVRLKGLPRLTEGSISTQPALLAELHRVRTEGFAIDNQENEPDGRCVAVPIVDAPRRIMAAISVSGPVHRMDAGRAESLVPELKRAATAILNALSRH